MVAEIIFGSGAPNYWAARFRKDFNTDQMHWSTTLPTATAGRFLGTGAGAREKAESLSRVIGTLSNPQDRSRRRLRFASTC